MTKLKFPPLKADQVECRVGIVGNGGFSVLLYKTARTDMDILDEVVGPERWQNDFVDVGGKLVCRLGIKTDAGDWIWKSDCGIEGNVGEEKSQASDARKRAGFAWGIGRELYDAPFIWLSAPTTRWSDGRWRLDRYPRLEVTEFESDGKKITRLVICDNYGNALFRHGDALKQARKEAQPAGQAKAAAATQAPAPVETPAAAPSPAAPAVMTKEQFRDRWNSDETGGGITFDDIADCAKAWGICSHPKILPITQVRDLVLEAAGCMAGVPAEEETVPAAPAETMIDDSLAIALDDLKKARSRSEIAAVNEQYKAVYGEYGSNRSEEYIQTLFAMCKLYPRETPKTK